MSNKLFYYMEITIPSYEGDNIAKARELQELHIEETGSKKSKIAKETVFADISVHNKVEDTQAITLEFLNERNFDTYMSVVAEFREWASANHGVTWSYEKKSTTTYDAVSILVEDTDDGVKTTYGQAARKYMHETLPTERGYK